MRQVISQSQNGERGQSLVEFSVTVIVIMTLIAGIIDLGRFLYTLTALRDAAQEGAVYASICPSDLSRIVAHVRQSADRPIDLQNDPKVSITCTIIPALGGSEGPCGVIATPGDSIQVRVAYNNFEVATPFWGIGSYIGLPTEFPLAAEVTDTILREDCP
jgi:hypothetical protein